MAQSASDKRQPVARVKRARKPSPVRSSRGQALSEPWATALARVKKHIQVESRHITHAG